MLNKFCKKPLYEVTRTMARVTMGVQKAETVIKNARLVNVCTAEIQEGIDVAIAEGRIALVGDASPWANTRRRSSPAARPAFSWTRMRSATSAARTASGS